MKVREDAPKLSELVNPLDPDGEMKVADMLPTFVLSKEVDYRDLTLKEFRELNDAIKMLSSIGSNELRTIREAGLERVEDYAGKCVEPMNEIDAKKVYEEGTIWHTLQSVKDKLVAQTTHTRRMLDEADGFTAYGKNPEHGVNRRIDLELQQGDNRKQAALAELITALAEPYKQMRSFDKRMKKERGKFFHIEGLEMTEAMESVGRFRFTAERVFSIALNCGNAGNLEAIMAGYGWDHMDPGEFKRKIFSFMNESEILAVQNVWDVFQSTYEDLNQAHIEMYNIPAPEGVEPEALTVKSSDGKYIHLNGGYILWHSVE